MNAYLIEDEGGMTLFDAGIRAMAADLLRASAAHGGIKRVVLGHSHADHRGAAPTIAAGGVPVYCHEAELADAIGDGGLHYFKPDQLNFVSRRFMDHMLHKVWDDGPVPITGTLSEGDEIAGFQVVHLPGHAPGQIGLFRERDGLVLASDTIYTLNPLTGLRGAPRIPLDAFNLDTNAAKASSLKLAALEPKAVWLGHANPLTADVAEVLRELGASA